MIDDYVEYYKIIRTYATMARVYLIDFNNSTIIMELLNSRSLIKKVFNIFFNLKFFIHLTCKINFYAYIS